MSDINKKIEESLQDMASNHVFVYGTLKKGFRAYSLLKGSYFLGKGLTEPGYSMVSLGFPMVLPSKDNGHRVQGEVYSVTDLTMGQLDRYEGYPNLYTRDMVDIELNSGHKVSAWMYVGGEGYHHSMTKREHVKPNKNGVLEWLQQPSEQ